MEKQLRQDVLDTLSKVKLPDDLINIETDIVPMRNEVLLIPVHQGQRERASGLIIPEFQQASQKIGRIVALGPECPSYLKKGMLIMYNHLSAQSIQVSAKDYVLVDSYTGIRLIIIDEKKVEVESDPLSGDAIKRMERLSNQTRIHKDMNQEFDNTMDKIHEEANYEARNPRLAKLKKGK